MNRGFFVCFLAFGFGVDVVFLFGDELASVITTYSVYHK
jgi:hypothetical protein